MPGLFERLFGRPSDRRTVTATSQATTSEERAEQLIREIFARDDMLCVQPGEGRAPEPQHSSQPEPRDFGENVIDFATYRARREREARAAAG